MEIVNEWLEEIDCEGELTLLSDRESSIKYYRLKNSMHSGIVVDFSKKEEAFKPFLALNLPLYEAGVTVPKIFTYNREEFLVFMEDLGSTHLCDIGSSDVELFYNKAIDAIVKMQNTQTEVLSVEDKTSLLKKIHLQKYFDSETLQNIQPLLETIVNELLKQPKDVFVHGNYQAKNLMFNCNDSIVVTEYYNASMGVVTYDLSSLLLDIDVDFNDKDIERMVLEFKDKKGLNIDNNNFIKWFYFTGIYHNLTRLNNNNGSLNIEFLIKLLSRYSETEKLCQLFKEKQQLKFVSH